ncbi:hypothetical protein H6P81_014808 [Aristolochia fimbriata]|uniref:Uncharacterized protein n=1 Tax=Aristolochia fimbriata TaxID=158543 RepID=A0AAV7E3Q0_ARIFI|nr:hypothetical protein H6P81_014808 [Aristolochia fimbriata]
MKDDRTALRCSTKDDEEGGRTVKIAKPSIPGNGDKDLNMHMLKNCTETPLQSAVVSTALKSIKLNNRAC